MTGGKFKSLNGNLFGPGNVLPAVTFLDLSHNHIEFVHGQALRGLPNLQSLILSHNSISVTESKPNHIDVPLASDLPRLKSLYLIEAFHQVSQLD